MIRNAMRRIDMEQDLTMLIGPASDGRLLGLGVDIVGDDPVVIHAMALRPRFSPFLG